MARYYQARGGYHRHLATRREERQPSPSSGSRSRAESDSDQSKDCTIISDTSSEAPELEVETEDAAGEFEELDTWLKNGAPGELLGPQAFIYSCGLDLVSGRHFF